MPCTCGPSCACKDGDCGCATGKCGCASGACAAKASAGCPCGPTCKCDNGSCGCATGRCCSMVNFPRMRSSTAHPLARGCFLSRGKHPAAAAWMPKRALSQSNVALPVSTQVRLRRLLPQVAVHDAVLGRPRHGRRRPRDGRHHRHDLCQDEVKLKPEGSGTVSGHRRGCSGLTPVCRAMASSGHCEAMVAVASLALSAQMRHGRVSATAPDIRDGALLALLWTAAVRPRESALSGRCVVCAVC